VTTVGVRVFLLVLAVAGAAGCDPAPDRPARSGEIAIDLAPNELLLGARDAVAVGPDALEECEAALAAHEAARGRPYCRRFAVELERSSGPVRLKGVILAGAPLAPADAAVRIEQHLSRALRPLGGDTTVSRAVIEDRIGRGLEYLLATEWCQVTMTWVLDQVLAEAAGFADPAVVERLRALRRSQLANHRETPGRREFLRLVDPSAAAVAATIRRRDAMGRTAMETWLSAAVNYPAVPLPPEVERELMSADGYDRYHLTHQLLALAWLARRGYGPADRVAARIDRLAQRMESELVAPRLAVPAPGQARSPFTDLYVESLAFIAYAAPDRPLADDHVALVLANQRADGSWLQSPHTTLDAIWLLTRLRRRIQSSTAAISSSGKRLGSTLRSWRSEAGGTTSASSSSARRRAASTAGP
jgi:hypothetical protein